MPCARLSAVVKDRDDQKLGFSNPIDKGIGKASKDNTPTSKLNLTISLWITQRLGYRGVNSPSKIEAQSERACFKPGLRIQCLKSSLGPEYGSHHDLFWNNSARTCSQGMAEDGSASC